MRFRFPDDPIRVPPHVILSMEQSEPGRHVAQPKYDGWRRPMYLENGVWKFFSKYLTGQQAKETPPADLVAELESLGFPDGTAFDAEWMGRRCTSVLRGKHYFVLFDLLYLGGQWQGDVPMIQRYGNLKTLLALHKAKAKTDSSRIELVPMVDSGLVKFYEQQRFNPLTEGIVVKAVDSGLKGGLSRATDNPKWLKVKYRD